MGSAREAWGRAASPPTQGILPCDRGALSRGPSRGTPAPEGPEEAGASGPRLPGPGGALTERHSTDGFSGPLEARGPRPGRSSSTGPRGGSPCTVQPPVAPGVPWLVGPSLQPCLLCPLLACSSVRRPPQCVSARHCPCAPRMTPPGGFISVTPSAKTSVQMRSGCEAAGGMVWTCLWVFLAGGTG